MTTRVQQSAGATLAAATMILSSIATPAQVPQGLLDRDANMALLAAEAARRGPVTAIPLIGDNSRTFGVVYDQFLIGAIVGRAEMATSGSATPQAILAHPAWQSRGTVVVAYPVNCDGRPNRPVAIRWKTSMPMPVEPAPMAPAARGADAQALLPGVGLPSDALVVNMRNALLVGASVDIDYENPVCRGAARTATLAISQAPNRELSTAFNGIQLPDALQSLPSPTTVRLSVVLDQTGRARFPTLVQGPDALRPAAEAALNARTFTPSTVNGVPMPLSALVTFVFTTTGAPGQAAPFTPAAPSPGTRVMSGTIAVPAPPPPSTLPPVPPAPPGQTATQLARLAIEVAKKGDPVPVPLDGAGPAVHGVLFDAFLMGAVAARAAERAGSPLDPETASPSLVQGDMVAVAFPLTCDGKTIPPTDLHLSMSAVGGRPGPIRENGPIMTGATLASRLPGVTLPPNAIGRNFAGNPLNAGVEVRVTYAETGCGADGRLTFPIQWVRGAARPRLSTAKLPDGSNVPSNTVVRLRGVVDLDGAYRFPTLADGPAELAAPAIAAASQWRFDPYRANGVASPQVVIMNLTFTTSGMPEEPPSATPPANPPAPPGMPPVMTSSTRGGRSTMDFTTPDQKELSAATSKCAIASDNSYGLTSANPVKVGGGPVQGPARERQYLQALRGPAGEGLRVVRLGTTMAPDRATILDLFEITYAGLATPIRVFLDEYHEAALQAPPGFTCASAIGG